MPSLDPATRQATAFSNSDEINALLSESPENPGQPAKWNVPPGGTLTYSFVTAQTANTYPAEPDETNIQEVSEPIKENVRSIMQKVYGQVLDLNFIEVPDSAQSNIRIMFSDGPGPQGNAYAYNPGQVRGGAIHLQRNNETSPGTAYSQGPDSFGYSTLIHEIAHTLGLKHPGNYNAGTDGNEESGEPPFLSFEEDNTRKTVMSYNPGSPLEGDPGAPEPRTLMPYDIRALQFLYGARRNTNSNDTLYKFNSFNFTLVQTIWDGGGNDTLDFSEMPAGQTYYFNLNQGMPLTTVNALNSFPYVLEASQVPPGGDPEQIYVTDRFGTYIAFNVDLENAIGSSADDQILGNSLANYLIASRGNDALIGNQGNDTLLGGKGADELIGGVGDDVLIGGGGPDRLTGGRGRDRFVLGLNAGPDTILDFTDGEDTLVLPSVVRLEQLSISSENNATVFRFGFAAEVLAILPGVSPSVLSSQDFATS